MRLIEVKDSDYLKDFIFTDKRFIHIDQYSKIGLKSPHSCWEDFIVNREIGEKYYVTRGWRSGDCYNLDDYLNWKLDFIDDDNDKSIGILGYSTIYECTNYIYDINAEIYIFKDKYSDEEIKKIIKTSEEFQLDKLKEYTDNPNHNDKPIKFILVFKPFDNKIRRRIKSAKSII